jgi:radical SAM superfamily enzyme YgiQ (UPF0313 family)
VQPPFYRLYKRTYSLDRFPLSLGYLGAAVRRDTTWAVRAYNADFHPESEPIEVRYRTGEGFQSYLRNLAEPGAPVWDEVRAVLRASRSAVVGISAKSQEFKSALLVARLAKELDPRTVVVIGGPHASMVGAEILESADVDVYVRGEGERTLVDLLHALERGDPLDGVDGIGFRRGERCIETAPRAFVEDLDALGFPHELAHEILIDFEKYPLSAFRNVFATRGCPRQCSFCGSHRIWSRRVRFRSPQHVVRELQALWALGLRSVHFDDDTFGVTRRRILTLCDAIREGCPGLTWSCELPVNLVDDRTLAAMKSAGCTDVQIGIESGNDEMLKRVRKDITIAQALEACALVKRQRLGLHAFFIVGFPWETEETLNDTLRAMKKTRCDTLSYSIFTPYPGTEMFAFCAENGLIGDDFDASLYNHQSPANCFCLHITRERFRQLVSRIERAVDRKHARRRLRDAVSLRAFRRARELGLAGSLGRLLRRLGRSGAGPRV